MNANGSPDLTFTPAVDGWVEALALQADGKILVGGCFGAVAGQARTNIARLNPDGSIDNTFNPGAGIFTTPGAGSTFVFSLAVQSDGGILVAGSFGTLDGTTRYGLGRLLPTGKVDPDFNPGANQNVYGLALQNDGKLLALGGFSTLAGVSRSGIGRINNNTPAVDRLSTDGASITWQRSGAAPEFSGVSFDGSGDGVNWTNLGAGVRVTGGWQYSGAVGTNAVIRARGLVAGAYHSGAGWVMEKFLGPPTTNRPALNLKLNGHLPLPSIQGDLRRPYTLEAASRLSPVPDWQPLTTMLLTNNPQTFVDWSGSNSNYRMYRVRLDQ